jgi:hypothetical protein
MELSMKNRQSKSTCILKLQLQLIFLLTPLITKKKVKRTMNTIKKINNSFETLLTIFLQLLLRGVKKKYKQSLLNRIKIIFGGPLMVLN